MAGLAHEALLALGVLVAVRRGLAVPGPGRASPAGSEAPDELPEPADVCLDQLLAEAGRLQLGANVAGPVGVLRLQPVVQDHVREYPASKTREQRPGLRRLDSLEAASEPRLRCDPAVGLQQQRVEEQCAELAISGPGLTISQPLEGAHVDEDRLRAAPLHVVGAAVLQDETVGQRLVEQPELDERRLPQHFERPLVRVGHERHPLVAQQPR